MKKILLAHPKTYPMRRVNLGLACMGAVLEKEGYTVKVYDKTPFEKKPFDKVLKEFNPDIVGFTCTTPQFSKAEEMATVVKKTLPNVPVVVGGVHPTTLPKEVLSKKVIDFAVIGEGEMTMLELIKYLEKNDHLEDVNGLGYKKGKKIIINKRRGLIENLDSLPFPARHLFPMEYINQKNTQNIRGVWGRHLELLTSRGCPYNCIFCSSKLMWTKKCRFRSTNNLLDEIEFLLSSYKVEGFYFIDDTFTLNKKRVLEFCKKVKERKLDLGKIQIQSRVDTIDEEMIKALKSIGVIQIGFGFESGSQKILNILKKGTTVQQALDAAKLCKKYKINILANFMIGNPYETREDIEKTVALAKKINAKFTDFFIATPFPKSELWEMAVKNNWLNNLKYDDMLIGWTNKKISSKFMEANFSSEELLIMLENIRKKFLKKKIFNFLTQPTFLKDMGKVLLSRPKLTYDIFKNYLNTKSMEGSLRILENAQREYKF